MSEDGRLMNGVWHLETPVPGSSRRLRTHGTWEAHREWAESEEPQSEPEAVGRALDTVAVAGR